MSFRQLKDVCGNFPADFPATADGNESLTLSAENVAPLPGEIETAGLYIQKRMCFYGSYATDHLHFHAHKQTYRQLGWLIFSVIFNPEPVEICLNLTHSESDIKQIIVEFSDPQLENLSCGYHSKPFAFEYCPATLKKHPFYRENNPANLPCFGLTNLEDLIYTKEDLENRDTVQIFGKGRALALLAELFLNLSQPFNEKNEIVLEGEGGFRGVGIHSAEVSFHLPGSFGWFNEHWK